MRRTARESGRLPCVAVGMTEAHVSAGLLFVCFGAFFVCLFVFRPFPPSFPLWIVVVVVDRFSVLYIYIQ